MKKSESNRIQNEKNEKLTFNCKNLIIKMRMAQNKMQHEKESSVMIDKMLINLAENTKDST
jgi:hypothetical protein